MSFLEAYAEAYEALYRDKDYLGEARYLHGLIHQIQPAARSMLELGCGQGRHAQAFASLGYEVVGCDLSAEMVARGNERLRGETSVRLDVGDLRTFRSEQRFDVVVSLFHVMSYLTTNADLHAGFATAQHHLKPGGLFLFDCWHTPGVFQDPPSPRQKTIALGDGRSLCRHAQPREDRLLNLVEIDYTLEILTEGAAPIAKHEERHLLRHLCRQEVDLLAHTHGFNLVDWKGWMRDTTSDTDWYALAILQKTPC